MPYITKEKVSDVRAKLKKRFPNVKFSVVRRDAMVVDVAVMSSPFEWGLEYFSINPYYPEIYPNAEFLKEVIAVMNEGNYTVSVDGDYGNIPKFYIDLTIGRWNRPHVTK